MCVARVSRGQRCGAPGHGRSMQTHLSERAELATLDSPHCPQCGLTLEEFPGTQDSEVLEIEVKAYRRVIQRQRYKCVCQCACLPGIVKAPAPANSMARGSHNAMPTAYPSAVADIGSRAHFASPMRCTGTPRACKAGSRSRFGRRGVAYVSSTTSSR